MGGGLIGGEERVEGAVGVPEQGAGDEVILGSLEVGLEGVLEGVPNSVYLVWGGHGWLRGECFTWNIRLQGTRRIQARRVIFWV